MKLNVIFLLFLIAIVGCDKDVDEFEPYVKTAISFPEVVDLKPIYKQFNADEMSEIDLGDGDVLVVPAHSIIDQSGALLSGKIDLSITQIHRKADLIYAFLNSNNGKLDNGQLENYHIINIKAYHESKEVFVKNGHQIILKSPSDVSIPTGKVWTGEHFSSNNFGWNQASSTLENDTWSIDGVAYSGVRYKANEFGWLTGAKEITGENTLCVNLIEGTGPTKTKVYFIYDDAFCVAELKIFSDTGKFCGTIPSGTSGRLIIINEEEKGQYRYQNTALTITEDTSISALPQITVLEDIILGLNSL